MVRGSRIRYRLLLWEGRPGRHRVRRLFLWLGAFCWMPRPGPAADDDDGEAGGGAEAEGVPRAGHLDGSLVLSIRDDSAAGAGTHTQWIFHSRTSSLRAPSDANCDT